MATINTLITYNSKNNKAIGVLFKKLRGTKFTGGRVTLVFALHSLPFHLAVAIKAGLFEVFAPFLPSASITGLCVATKLKHYSSSIILRTVESGYLVDRKFYFFTPKLIYFYTLDSQDMVRKKSKFYSFVANSQKKLLAKFLN